MQIKTFIFNPVQENTYVIFDETSEAAIIDAGCCNETEQKQLAGFISYNNLKIKHLLNTHLHFDHQLGNYFAAKTFGALPEAHHEDVFMIETLEESLNYFGFPLKTEKQPLGKELTENDVVTFGNTILQIIHVPGHSPGSLCFYNQKDGVLFSGDVLFRGTIGRTDLPYGNYDELIAQIQKKLLVLPPKTVIYPGHGATTTIEFEKNSNPYL